MIQEALSNVVKHSAATTASVCLGFSEEEKLLYVEVRDNGRGFSVDNMEWGIGLIGMRERVFGVGGKLDIRTAVDGGAEVVIELKVSDG